VRQGSVNLHMRTAVLAAALLIAGCGSASGPQTQSLSSASSTRSPVTNPSGLSSPSAASASPNTQLLVIAEGQNVAHSYDYGELFGATSLRLVTATGRQVSDFALKAGVQVLAVAGSRIFVMTSAYELKAIDSNGNVEDLGSLGTCPAACPGLGFAPSPDGTHWLWGTTDGSRNSFVHEAGANMPPRIVEQALDGGQTLLRPYVWTQAGAFVQHIGVGLGGYAPFPALFAPADRLDLDRGTATTLPAGSQCSLGDVAFDGTIACFPLSKPGNLHLVDPAGKLKDITLDLPQFNMVGDAWFAPSGGVIALAGATGVGSGIGPNGQPEQYTTDLARTDGTISPFGPAGVRPAMGPESWLGDGQLVLWRPKGAAGGQPGLYVLDTSGQGPFILDSGVPVGVLSAS
jgi:hypothetical protein